EGAFTYSLPSVPASGNLNLGSVARIFLEEDFLVTLATAGNGTGTMRNIDVSDIVDLKLLDARSYPQAKALYHDRANRISFVGHGNTIAILDNTRPDALEMIGSVQTNPGSIVQAIHSTDYLMIAGTSQGLEFF